MQKSLSDEELMMAYQSGDVSAFEELYKRHSGRVLGYFLSKKADMAQEIVQETFLKLHRNRDQYSSSYPFLPWLFTIARNTHLDFFKKNESLVRRKSETLDFSFDLAAVDLPSTSTQSFSEEVLLQLSSDQRRAIELRYLREWSFEKIADELQTTPQNIRQVISRGIRKLKGLFANNGDLE